MSLASIEPHGSPLLYLIVLVSFVWPFVVFSSVRPRGNSPAPIAGALVPIAFAEFGMWMILHRAIQGMAISGGGHGAVSAGIAEAFFTLVVAVYAIALNAVLTLVRRHRVYIDHVTAALAFALILILVTALLFARSVAPTLSQFRLSFGWAMLALLIAISSAIWFFMLARGRVTTPIRFGIPITLLTFAMMAIVVYEHVERYRYIAMGG